MDTPPQSAAKDGRRHIPAEIVSEILWKLPVKSLLRFSSVSTAWHLIINQPYFSNKYRGRQKMILRNPNSGGFRICHLSAAVSNTPIEEATHVDVFNFDRNFNDIKIRAVCNGLCFLESQISLKLFIWNPTNRKFHKLPLYPFPTPQQWPLHTYCEVFYGLGFDLIGDDYKVLRILIYEAALYSLRSNSWRKIQSFPKIDMWSCRKTSCFVNGAFYWLCNNCVSGHIAIVSFDLSKEEYGEVALPPEYVPPNIHESYRGEVGVLRGRLCLSRNYMKMGRRFVLWVMEMEDDGAWSKKFDIGYGVFDSRCIVPLLRPLCRFDDDDDGEEAICVTSHGGESWVILRNKDGKTIVKKNFGREAIYRDYGFVYVESLVSPAALVTSHHNKEE